MEIEATVVEMEQPSTEKTPAQWHQHWQKEMSAAERRLRKYKKVSMLRTESRNNATSVTRKIFISLSCES